MKKHKIINSEGLSFLIIGQNIDSIVDRKIDSLTKEEPLKETKTEQLIKQSQIFAMKDSRILWDLTQ